LLGHCQTLEVLGGIKKLPCGSENGLSLKINLEDLGSIKRRMPFEKKDLTGSQLAK
jgi:hypothetical protein